MLSQDKQNAIRALADVEGHIRPDDVIDAARIPGSILHDEFIWDTAEAARQHWRYRAEELIRLVKLEVRIDRKLIYSPGYVRDPVKLSGVSRFLDITQAAKDRETALGVLREELDRIAAAIRRAQVVAAVLGMTADLERMLADVAALETKAERTKKAKDAGKKSKTKPRRGGRRSRSEDRPTA